MVTMTGSTHKPAGQERSRESDRGQAFTLEGLIGAILVITALLYAVQVVVVTPTTGGAIDSSVRTDLQQEAEDTLLIASQAEEEPLSELVRNWSQSQRTFSGAVNPDIGYGTTRIPGELGQILNETFTSRGRLYNVEVSYLQPDPSNGTGSVTMASQGTPSTGSVIASQRVVLYDNMTLTADSAGTAELWQYDTHPTKNPQPGKSGYYPVPNAVDGSVYNVLEVRLIVW
ncbi:Putative pilin/flagellin [Halorhabdus sp. SVX81]|nr:Putative pilin/flagellin [Halorhabdus sp. SVX81]